MVPPHCGYATVWASLDTGATWHRVGHLETTGLLDEPWIMGMTDVVAFESRFVAVGSNAVYLGTPPPNGNDSGRPDAAIWIGEWVQN
jgi:hypothetical protein